VIREIGAELQTALRARGVPFDVVVGPEATRTTTWGRERIVIEYAGQDKFVPVRSQRHNAKHYGNVQFGGKLTIYAKSAKAGAMPWEHRRRAHAVMRQCVVALSDVLYQRKNDVAFTGGELTVPADLVASEVHGGAAYELRFTFEASIPDRDWAGDAADEVNTDDLSFANQTRARHAGTDEGDPYVTSCGE